MKVLHQGWTDANHRNYADWTTACAMSEDVREHRLDIGHAYGLLFGAPSCNGRSLDMLWAYGLCVGRWQPAQNEPAVKHQQSV